METAMIRKVNSLLDKYIGGEIFFDELQSVPMTVLSKDCFIYRQLFVLILFSGTKIIPELLCLARPDTQSKIGAGTRTFFSPVVCAR